MFNSFMFNRAMFNSVIFLISDDTVPPTGYLIERPIFKTSYRDVPRMKYI